MFDVREFIQQDKIDKGYPLEGIVYRAQLYNYCIYAICNRYITCNKYFSPQSEYTHNFRIHPSGSGCKKLAI